MSDALISAIASVMVAGVTGIFGLIAHRRSKNKKEVSPEACANDNTDKDVQEHFLVLLNTYQEQSEALKKQSDSINETNLKLNKQVLELQDFNEKLSKMVNELKEEIKELQEKLRQMSAMNATYEMQIKMLLEERDHTYLSKRQ